MNIPRLLALTDRSQLLPGRSLADQVTQAVSGGLGAVVLRERDLPAGERAELAIELAGILTTAGGVLIVAAPWISGGAGVHLRRGDAAHRPPGLVGRSCHDAAELRRAREEGVDYVTLSPVAASTSKPGYGPVLGANGLSDLLGRVPEAPPVFGLGGVRAPDAKTYRAAGAYGVAIMGELMRAADPAAVVRAFDQAGVTSRASQPLGPCQR